jgi:hypothetical protein
MASTVAEVTPTGRLRLGERRRRAAAQVRGILRRAVAPVKAPALELSRIPFTVAGLGCIDAAAFLGCTIAGLVVTGFSLFALEYLIADDE